MIRYSCAIGTTGTFTPARRAELRGEHAARVDDDLGLDLALVGLDAGDAAALDADAGHARVRGDLRAAAPRALGQRERELARVDVAVGRQVRGAEHAVGRHRREELLRLLGARSARAAGRTSSPSRPGARAPPSAPRTRRAAASRPRASRSRARPRRRASGTARPSSSSSASGESEPRSWPTRPAEWNVEPLVRSARSTSTTSSQPSFVSQ